MKLNMFQKRVLSAGICLIMLTTLWMAKKTGDEGLYWLMLVGWLLVGVFGLTLAIAEVKADRAPTSPHRPG